MVTKVLIHDIISVTNLLHCKLSLPKKIFFNVRICFCAYLSDWRFDYYVLKAVVCFYCLEILVKYGNLFLIVPT